MVKKEIRIEDVKSEDIQKEIDKHFYGKNVGNFQLIPKLLTFILLFCLYIFLSVYIQDYAIRIIVIFFGLITLIVLFQNYIFPNIRKKL